MNLQTTKGAGAECGQMRAIVRRARVLNYDLARWVTELRPQLRSKNHSLRLEIDEAALPPVLCDRQQLRQVVVAMVTTAHTFTDAGAEIVLSAYPAGNFLRIEVKDTGHASAGRSRAIEPFARTIVEAHGGCIESEPASGNTLAFTVPVHKTAPDRIGLPAA